MQTLSIRNNYKEVFESIDSIESDVHIVDHLWGFNEEFGNIILDTLHDYAVKHNKKYTVYLDNPIESRIQGKYPNFKIFYNYQNYMFDSLYEYRIHPPLTFDNFLCSFNNSGQVGRQMLVSILNKFNLYNPEYCSKNFQFTSEQFDGNLENFLSENQTFYKKFFASESSEQFFQSQNSFGDTPSLHQHMAIQDHSQNIHRLENKITDSFLQLVSESHSCSYYPMVTEKFLYSVVTRGLYLAYAQPNWHDHLLRLWGFKPFTKIFNYDFDKIQNPVIRLVELLTMISKFSKLSNHDLHDIYQVESDTIEYNYDHYFSKKFKQHLKENLPNETFTSGV